MTTGNPLKLFLTFSIPLFIGNIFQQLYSMVDTIIVGRYLGAQALAGVGSTGSLNFMINGCLFGLTGGFSVLVAQRFGAKDEKGIKKAIASNIVLTIIFSLAVTIVMLFLTEPLLHIMNTPPDIFEHAYKYISIIFLGVFTLASYNMLAGILRALGDSKTPLYFLIIACILNIFLDIAFIVNLGMGSEGAGWATVISQAIAAILCLIYSFIKFKQFRPTATDFKDLTYFYKIHLKIGVPMALQYSVTSIGVVIVQIAINGFGSTIVAAFTAASRVLQLIIQPLLTYGVATATFVAQNLGAGRIDRIKEGVNCITKISIITSILGGFILVFAGKPMISLFLENPDPEILYSAQQVLNYASAFIIPLGFIFVFRNVLQSIGQSFVPMLVGAIELVARAVVVYTLPDIIGFIGICIADPIAWVSAAIPLVTVYLFQIKKLEAAHPSIEQQEYIL
ncbi:MATE family efflux transporter [Candidatus Epulonipiscium fishelsonii]|uniref:MATE family efflux transporter n=1 Tax=Candidatus Epulonipiscium fishelsonii TaxID=77094 RepID=A0ACC8XH12_9FIRM|nr:MATE family efflux transporter [Epulopiscium sp. SCG-B05WGA-EpuloA1]ONI42786.1 MATE family efflux transporter [Epulopiscium sp. SCG-B11WGA-EpuloA1]